MTHPQHPQYQGYGPAPARPAARGRRGSLFLGLAATAAVASAGLLAGYFVLGSGNVATAEAAQQDTSANPEAIALARSAARSIADAEVTLAIGDATVTRTWASLGVVVDESALPVAAHGLDPAGGAEAAVAALSEQGRVPVQVSREPALEALGALKQTYDRAPQRARMDLEARVVYREQPGRSLDVYAAVTALAAAARTGASEVALPVVEIPADFTVADLGVEDISEVLGTFTTKFSVSDRIRNDNLKIAASKLNGYVLQPGVEFSFNDTVGPRTFNEGYKIAGVIQAGELVDGLAGGTCQISSTLHGAAFFAGIGIVKSTPHSRPSTYVHMGLDATVVYPFTDLKLRNDYDFPVVIHYKVHRGDSTVEILGKERVYDKIAFERKVIEKLDFDTVTREDDTMPVGTSSIDQYGFYGYKVERLRKFYQGGKQVKRDRWLLRYAPVTEYMRTGSNPDPNLRFSYKPEKPKKKKKKLKEPGKETFRLVQ